MRTEEYRDGQLNGVTVEYYPEGLVFKETPYVAGNISGEVVTYDLQGEVLERYEVVSGEADAQKIEEQQGNESGIVKSMQAGDDTPEQAPFSGFFGRYKRD